MKFKQKILYSYAPTISERSRLDSDVFAKADTLTLSDDHSDYGSSQCPSKDSLLQIDDKDNAIIVPNSQASLLLAIKSLALLWARNQETVAYFSTPAYYVISA